MKDCFYLLEFSKILSVFVFLIIYLSVAYVLRCFFVSNEIRVCSIFSGAGKFCLARGLRQLTRDNKSDVSCLQMFFTHRKEKRRMTFGVGRHTT